MGHKQFLNFALMLTMSPTLAWKIPEIFLTRKSTYNVEVHANVVFIKILYIFSLNNTYLASS